MNLRHIMAAGLFALLLPTYGADNPIVYGNKRITLISPTLIRLEYAEKGEFLDAPTMFAINRDSIMRTGFEVKEFDEGKKVSVNTGKVLMTFVNDNLPFGQGNTWFQFTRNGKEMKSTARNLHSKRRNLNLGGSVVTLDAVQNEIPTNDGLLSEDGWYYIVDTGNEYLTPDGWFAQRSANHVQDQYCFIYGDDFHAPFKDLGIISGKVPMTRRYMHGIWYSRWYPYDDKYISDLISGFNEHGFPLDVLSMDMDWHTINDAKAGTGHNNTALGWTGFSWNRELIKDPIALVGKLHADSIRVCVNEHPHDGIRPHEDCYASFMKAMGYDNPRDTVLLFNAGDKHYMENFIRESHRENHDIGIDFWWLDWQQDYLYPYVRGSRLSHVKWLNRLYYADTERNGLRGAGYSRWGGWGDHRYPINFSGDAYSNWDVLKFEVKLTQTSGNQGCYYWAHDTGGFAGATNPELLSRWSQFCALSAALRTHAHRGEDADRRPWIWGDIPTSSMRNSYRFRSEIMPYVYTTVRKTHDTMLPFNRCMFVDYPLEKNAYNRYGQFLLGDLLLAAPITSPGKGVNFTASTEIWFPADSDWYDFFTDERHSGGSVDIVKKDLDTFPVFLRGGYLFPMQPFTRRPGTERISTLRLRVYPGRDGDNNTFRLYEDDGVTLKYKDGDYAFTPLRYEQNGNKVTMTVLRTHGKYDGQLPKRSYSFELGAFDNVRNIKVNGHKVKPEIEHGRIIVNVPETSVKKPVKVEFTFNPAVSAESAAEYEVGSTLAPLGGFDNLTDATMKELKEAGLDCIEISLTGLVNGDNPIPFPELKKRMRNVRKAADAAGIRIRSIHMPYHEDADISFPDEDKRVANLKNVRDYIDAVSVVDAEYILFHPSAMPGVQPGRRQEHISALVKSINELNPVVKEIGAHILIENMRGPKLMRSNGYERGLGRTVEEMESIMALMPEDVYVCVDLNHISEPEKLIRAMGKKIKSLHVCDSDGSKDCHWLPGKGTNDWAAIFASLRDVGYDGPWLYELKATEIDNGKYAQLTDNYNRCRDAYLNKLKPTE